MRWSILTCLVIFVMAQLGGWLISTINTYYVCILCTFSGDFVKPIHSKMYRFHENFRQFYVFIYTAHEKKVSWSPLNLVVISKKSKILRIHETMFSWFYVKTHAYYGTAEFGGHAPCLTQCLYGAPAREANEERKGTAGAAPEAAAIDSKRKKHRWFIGW